MTQRDRFGQIGFQAHGGSRRTGDLRNFQRVRQAGAEVIALMGHEHLGLFLQAAKGAAMDDPVAVPGKGCTGAAIRLRDLSPQ